jgi:hypothetical protein
VTAWLGAGVIAVVLIVYAIKLAAIGKAWPGIPVLLVMCLPFIAFCLRMAITKVHVETDGVRIVNMTRTVFVRWEEIGKFSVGRHGLLPKVGIAELRDGRQIGMWAIQGPNPVTRPNNRNAEHLIDGLNAELARHTSPATNSDGSAATLAGHP